MAVFSKILSPAGVGSALCWPTSWLGYLPPFPNTNQVHFQALDAHKRVWSFTSSIRRQGRPPKPELLQSSWLPFVMENGLVAKDLVTFYYNPDQPIHFKIWFRKYVSTSLMGRDIDVYGPEE